MLWPVRIWGIHPVYQHPVFGTGGTHFPIQDIQYPPPNLFPKRHEQPQAPCLDDNHGMKFDNAWNQGVWYALRSATGRPSPQPFSVENLPALGEECRRIMKITSAVYTSKRRYQKVVRKRGVIKSLLNEIRFKLLELQQKENDGLLMLDKLNKHGINGLIRRQ